MYICTVCRFETEIDDAVVPTANGCCVCLLCYLQCTGNLRPMSRELRRDVHDALAALMPDETQNFRHPFGYRP